MSWTTIGHCPKCGAPIYAPMFHQSVMPPPNQKSYSCVPGVAMQIVTTCGTAGPCDSIPDCKLMTSEADTFCDMVTTETFSKGPLCKLLMRELEKEKAE